MSGSTIQLRSLAFKLQEPRNQVCAGGKELMLDDFKSYYVAFLKLVSSSSLEIDYMIRGWIMSDVVEKTREILLLG